MLTGIATVFVYGLIAIVVWGQQSVEGYLITDKVAMFIFMVLSLVLVLTMWLIIYGVYTRIIFPTYQTLIIVNSVLESESGHRKQSPNLQLLQDCIQRTLYQLGESRLTYTAVFRETERYIDRLGKLSEQNTLLEQSRSELAEIVDELKKKQEQLSLEKVKIDSIINAIPNGIIASSRDGNIFMVNKEAEDMLGANGDHLLGKFLDTVYPLNTLKKNPVYESTPTVEALKGDVTMLEFEYRVPKTKQVRSVQNIASPIVMDGEIIGAIDLLRDVTKEKEVDRAQKEFVSLASHQLRTPITSIHWNAEILSSDPRLAEDLKEHVDEILEENKRMQRLVNALLNLSRIDLGSIKFVLDKISLDEFIQGLVKSLDFEVIRKRLNVIQNVDKSIVLVNDPVHLDVIVSNLLSNAIKYTSESGTVELRAYSVPEESMIQIEVADNGFGIPKNQQSQIFGRLFRADNAKEKETDGNGLGLYVVKKLVESMNGTVWFESQEGVGTTFFVKIPQTIALQKPGKSMV